MINCNDDDNADNVIIIMSIYGYSIIKHYHVDVIDGVFIFSLFHEPMKVNQ